MVGVSDLVGHKLGCAKLICVFVFPCAKSRFSHDADQLIVHDYFFYHNDRKLFGRQVWANSAERISLIKLQTTHPKDNSPQDNSLL